MHRCKSFLFFLLSPDITMPWYYFQMCASRHLCNVSDTGLSRFDSSQVRTDHKDVVLILTYFAKTHHSNPPINIQTNAELKLAVLNIVSALSQPIWCIDIDSFYSHPRIHTRAFFCLGGEGRSRADHGNWEKARIYVPGFMCVQTINT